MEGGGEKQGGRRQGRVKGATGRKEPEMDGPQQRGVQRDKGGDGAISFV